MGAEPNPAPRRGGWTIERAEALLASLTGVVSVRVVGKPGGDIQEIHVLTTEEVQPKQTVRNVESALLAHLDLGIDHRVISVAQTQKPAGAKQEGAKVLQALSTRPLEDRILFHGHQIESERTHQVRMTVEVEWKGERFRGDATGPDLPRARLDTVATATLKAVAAAARAAAREADADDADDTESDDTDFTLALDGVRLVDAFERTYALVAVHAMSGRHVTPLAGAAGVADAADRAVVLATLQATDRWVRGRA